MSEYKIMRDLESLTALMPERIEEIRRSAQADAVFRAALFFRSLACKKCEKAGRALRGSRHDLCRPWMRASSYLLQPWMLDDIVNGLAARKDGSK